MFSDFFQKKKNAVYEILSKNMVKPERPKMTIWQRVAWWIIKTTCAPAPVNPHPHSRVHARTSMHTQTNM